VKVADSLVSRRVGWLVSRTVFLLSYAVGTLHSDLTSSIPPLLWRRVSNCCMQLLHELFPTALRHISQMLRTISICLS